MTAAAAAAAAATPNARSKASFGVTASPSVSDLKNSNGGGAFDPIQSRSGSGGNFAPGRGSFNGGGNTYSRLGNYDNNTGDSHFKSIFRYDNVKS